MEQELTNKRIHALDWGRGVTAAQQTFNLPGGGSNPPGPIGSWVCSSTVRAGSLQGPDDGSTPPRPTERKRRDQGVSGSILGSYPSK